MTTVTEMYLCETERLFLKPNQLYRFAVHPNCARCQELELITAASHSEPSAPPLELPEPPTSHFTGVEPEYIDAMNHGSDMTVEKLLDIVANGQTGKFGGAKLQQLADWIVAHRE